MHTEVTGGFRRTLHSLCCRTLEEKLTRLQQQVAELVRDAANDSKNTAGDKHETARAMMQLEQEKLGGQIAQLEKQLAQAIRYAPAERHKVVAQGSLVKTGRGWIYLLTALGEVVCEGEKVMVLSLQSPLGLKMAGLSAGAAAEINGIRYAIESVY